MKIHVTERDGSRVEINCTYHTLTFEETLQQLDPFQKWYDANNKDAYQGIWPPCFMPSRNRNNYMKTVREMEMHPERFANV